MRFYDVELYRFVFRRSAGEALQQRRSIPFDGSRRHRGHRLRESIRRTARGPSNAGRFEIYPTHRAPGVDRLRRAGK